MLEARYIGRPTRAIAAALTALALAACGTSPGGAADPSQRSMSQAVPSTQPEDTAEAASQELREREPAPAPEPEPEPRGLSGEALYRLLVADLAGRQGAIDAAVRNYLRAARVTRDPRIAERATRLGLYAGDTAAALAAAKRWIELAPDSSEAHAALARLRLRQGKVRRARTQMQRVIELTRGGTGAGLDKVAGLAADSSHPAAALAAIAGLADAHPRSTTLQYTIAELAARTGDPERALAALERVLRLAPAHTEALLLRARIRIRQGHIDAALEQLGDANRRHPADRALALGYVELLVSTGRTGRAAREMQQVHERFGTDPYTVRTLALLAMQAGLWNDATLYLEQLLAMGVDASMAHYYLGRIAQQQGDCSRALRHYIKVRRGEHRFEASLRAALCMAAIGRRDEARLHLERMRARYSADGPLARIAITRARIERQAGRAQQALRILGNALERDPRNTELRYTRALTAADVGRFELARSDLNTILDHQPDNARALNALGYILANRGVALDRAQALIERAMALNPGNAATLDSMGWVLYRQGQARRALEYLRRAWELSQGPEIGAHLGEVLWTLGRREEARGVWQQAREHAASGSPHGREILRQTIHRFMP